MSSGSFSIIETVYLQTRDELVKIENDLSLSPSTRARARLKRLSHESTFFTELAMQHKPLTTKLFSGGGK